MALVTFFALILWKKDKLSKAKWLLRALGVSVSFPMIANQVGWIAAEVGRQPWIVYKVLKTSDGVSKSLVAGEVLWSLIMLILVYSFLFVLFLYLLDRKIKQGPIDDSVKESNVAEVYRNPSFKE